MYTSSVSSIRTQHVSCLSVFNEIKKGNKGRERQQKRTKENMAQGKKKIVRLCVISSPWICAFFLLCRFTFRYAV